jgi:hypothetical protein
MGHRMNVWIQRLLVPGFIAATFGMRLLGFGVWRSLAILVPVLGLLVVVMIVADPGPRAKGFVEGLKSCFR